MKILLKTTFLLLSGSLILMTGCASSRPAPYANLSSAPQLQPNSHEDADRTPYVYSSPATWSNYSAVIIEPVEIYKGADHQFGNLPNADKQELAQYMGTEFSEVLHKRFSISSKAAPNTLRLKLTLTGTETNTAMVSTFTRFDLVGMPYNVVQGVRGKEGVFMGSVSYSVEIYDAASNRLLKAFVTKQHPNAMNIVATVGSLHAAKTGIDKGAKELLTQLQ